MTFYFLKENKLKWVTNWQAFLTTLNNRKLIINMIIVFKWYLISVLKFTKISHAMPFLFRLLKLLA